LEAVEEFRGLLAAVRLHQPDDDVGPAIEAAPCFAEHGEGLADARSRAEVDPQLPSARLRGCILGGHAVSVPCRRRRARPSRAGAARRPLCGWGTPVRGTADGALMRR